MGSDTIEDNDDSVSMEIRNMMQTGGRKDRGHECDYNKKQLEIIMPWCFNHREATCIYIISIDLYG